MRGPVSVTVRQPLFPEIPVPVPQPRVAFIDADGSTQVMTPGADGAATALVHRGASVVAVWQTGLTSWEAVVYLGLSPGASLDARAWNPDAGTLVTTSPGQVTMSLDCPDPPYGLVVNTRCLDWVSAPHPLSAATVTWTGSVLAYCTGVDDGWVIVEQSTPTATPRYTALVHQDFTALAGGPLPLPPLEPSTLVTATCTGVPDGADVAFTLWERHGWRAIWGRLYESGTVPDPYPAPPPVGGTTGFAQWIPPVADDTAARTVVTVGDGRTERFLRRKGFFSVWTAAFDGPLPPAASGLRWDGPARTVRWDEALPASARPVDIVTARGVYQAAPSGRTVAFTIYAPHTSSSAVRLPAFPPALGDVDLGPEDVVSVSSVRLVDVVGLDGFDAVVGTSHRDLGDAGNPYPEASSVELWATEAFR